MNKQWDIKQSEAALRTINPIRQIVDGCALVSKCDKKHISLSIGDPTLFDNLKTDNSIVESITNNLKSFKHNGYVPAQGMLSAREAIARKFSYGKNLTKQDVYIASGASGALEIIFNTILDKNTNILLPNPGFSLYKTLALSKGINIKYYNLLADRNWEIDLQHVKSLIDDNTAAILVNNPSNPCGSVLSKENLLEILEISKNHKIPIISDEIYFDMTFKNSTFYSLIELNDDAPLFVVSGLAKKYLVPGWRVGWFIYYDPKNICPDIRDPLSRTCQLIIGANTIVQCSMEDILFKTPQTFYEKTMEILEDNAQLSVEILGTIKGLKCIVPQGAMYMMVGIETNMFRDIKDDVEFMEKLYVEQNVMCLPGKCFGYPNYFRIVISSPKDILNEAYLRIKTFCNNHYCIST